MIVYLCINSNESILKFNFFLPSFSFPPSLYLALLYHHSHRILILHLFILIPLSLSLSLLLPSSVSFILPSFRSFTHLFILLSLHPFIHSFFHTLSSSCHLFSLLIISYIMISFHVISVILIFPDLFDLNFLVRLR